MNVDADVGRAQVGPRELRSSDVVAGEVGPSEVGAAEVRTTQVDAAEVGAAEVRAAEVDAAEVGTAEVVAAEVVAAEVRSTQVVAGEIDAAEVVAAKVRAAQVGPAEVRPAEVGPAEVGPAEVVAGERRVTFTDSSLGSGATPWQPAPASPHPPATRIAMIRIRRARVSMRDDRAGLMPSLVGWNPEASLQSRQRLRFVSAGDASSCVDEVWPRTLRFWSTVATRVRKRTASHEVRSISTNNLQTELSGGCVPKSSPVPFQEAKTSEIEGKSREKWLGTVPAMRLPMNSLARRREASLVSLGAVAIFAAAGASCVGEIGGDSTDNATGGEATTGGDPTKNPAVTEQGPCVSTTLPRSVLPLSRLDYDRSVSAVLGDSSNQAEQTFPPETRANGYTSNAGDLVVDVDLVYKLLSAGETIASNVVEAQKANLAKSCSLSTSPSATTPDACAMQYITQTGKQLYRRPLTTSESSGLYAVYLVGFKNPDPGVPAATSAIESTITAMLYSPAFFYRTELGDPSDTNSPVVDLTQYEVASKISYAATGAPPDVTLMALADSQSLNSPAVYQEQFQRLVDTEIGHDRMSQFVMEWIGSDTVRASASGTLTAAVAKDMVTETQQTIQQGLFSGSGELSELLTANYTFLNSELASYYGIDGVTGSSFTQVLQPSSQGRAGILGQGSFLAASATRGVAPLHRGKLLLEQLFCEQLPSFASLGLPGFTPPQFVPPAAGTTTREALSTEIAPGSACYSCHQNFMFMGFGLENFDVEGRFRTTDNGGKVDASGSIRTSTSVDPRTGAILAPNDVTSTSFADFSGLATDLGADPNVSACFAKQIAVYTSGRAELPNNDCAVRSLQTSFAAAHGNVVSGFSAYVQSPQFVQRSR